MLLRSTPWTLLGLVLLLLWTHESRIYTDKHVVPILFGEPKLVMH